MQRKERFDHAERIIRVAFLVNATMMIFNLLVGYWWQSDAVFANGLECACDVMIILSARFALRFSGKAFDELHPYGHGRAENLAALILSIFITITGIWILYESVRSTINGNFKSPAWPTVVAAIVTVISMEWLSSYSRKSGEKLSSPMLLALAKDFRKDSISAVATFIGVIGTFLSFGFMDQLAAIVVSLFIIHIGYKTFCEAAYDLMDGTAPADFIEALQALVESVEQVEHVHEMRARRSGQYMIVDLKLEMDPNMTVKQSHDVATRVKKLIFDHYPSVGDVMIHINPHDEEHEDLIRL